MRKIFFLFLLFIVSEKAITQTSNFKYEFQTPPSPNASSLGIYGEIPVDYYTGLPKINIPLLKVNTRSLNLDISLSYHMGGIRVDEEASWVGLGWSLNGQGVITRVIKAREDEANNTSCPDKDPDMFYFNFFGQSGKFIIHPETKEIILINKEPVTISKINPNNFLDGFLIILNNGAKVYFDVKEYQENIETVGSTNYTTAFVTSWFISKIESADGDIITFEYSEEFPTKRAFRSYTDFHTTSLYAYTLEWASGNTTSATCYTKQELGLDNQDPTVPFLTGNSLTVRYRNKYLKKINFDNGSIEFLISNREDLRDAGANSYGQKLDQIILTNKAGTAIRKTSLEYTYMNSQAGNGELSKRMMLAACKELIPGLNTMLNSYKLFYNNTQLPDKNSRDQDYWGFYNGPKNNPVIPSQSNNQPDPFYCKAGVLEKIVYPAGGYTVFEAGINEYVDRTNMGITYQGGGLRINKIISYAKDGQIAGLKKYEYKKTGQNGQTVCSGKSIGVVRNRYDYINNYLGSPYNYKKYLIKKNSSCAPIYQNGSPVYEMATIRYISHNEATSSSNTLPLGEYSSNGNPVCYEKVIEYFDENGVQGKTVYEFRNDYAIPDLSNNYYYPANMPQVVPIANGQLLKKSIYKYSGSSSELIYERSNSYSSKAYQEITCKRKTNLGNIAPACGFQPDYKIFSDWIVMNSETENQYSGNTQVLTEQILYSYDNPLHKQITKRERTTSAGGVETEIFKYPHDFSGNPVYQSMINKNITAPVVEYQKRVTINGNSEPILGTKTEYDNFFTTLQLPKSEFIQTGANPIEERIRYNYDNKGQVVEQNKLNDLKSAFIWDNTSTYLIAEVTGAGKGDIAHTSFEAGTSGGWTYSIANTVNDAESPTGKNKYNLLSGVYSANISDPLKSYTVSLWVKGQKPSFAILTSPQYEDISDRFVKVRSTNGWDLYSGSFSGASEISINNFTGTTIYIDELRLFPKLAFMTTYTYEPLVGMTTKCDPNNRIFRYEYDANNRLTIIRDQDKNILKKICYNYAGQPENCISACTNVTPDWQNTTTPLRCQQSICGNTGYQEQEQKDMNPCSPTYSQTKWIVMGYNPTVCPASPNVTITYSNTTGIAGFTALYTNAITGQTYCFAVPTGSGALGCIPPATYLLTVSNPGNIPLMLFGCGCKSVSGTTANFYKVNVSASTCNTITIEPEN